ncbi:deazaflavin-dependent oxidoreductase, nitroreductase family [Streptomyces sp. DvalAA-14]|uniref:nitroreductase family deazaflavin-dependent oxidoreductase n=1 Tax=unclassified Streptomyces TaxID=2593676 RepID=UPI00081B98E6|nr:MULTISPECIES: nitroreductase family deazaflavin-dependent oxidoreductase [unclassified Streptomyces]MYS21926.1 nitroreductase family deazaflavin-dependent oxidoreductase [Streptomyces sp. SID4948]SCE04572.1 deazaflavin-dependent oxidoreductase, nitroreductase family [Streptomyces sp. DvalAA-14]
MTLYDPATVKISPEPWVAEQARRYEESDGTEGTDFRGSPCLLLDYRGRVSGDWRRTVLIYGRDGDDYLIVASKGGAPQHPKWFPSLQEHPEVHLRVLGERFAARAEVLSAQEKARVWPHLVEVYPPYEDYQQKTDRDIPVIRLSRI